MTSLPFGPIAEAGPSRTPSTLVGNTGQSHSATATITQQYAMGFRLGNHGQGYEISSVLIDLAAVPSSLSVSLWVGGPLKGPIYNGVAAYKLFDFETPSSFEVGLNEFTAPAGAFAYQNVEHFIVLSGFGASLSINETTSDAEDAGGEPGAILFDSARVRALNATGRWPGTPTTRTSVLRLAVEGSRRDRGILASNYAQDPTDEDPVDLPQEIISKGDKGGMPITLGAADRYLIRGFSWLSDDSTPAAGGITTRSTCAAVGLPTRGRHHQRGRQVVQPGQYTLRSRHQRMDGSARRHRGGSNTYVRLGYFNPNLETARRHTHPRVWHRIR